MANTLRIKRRAAGGAVGAPSSMANAELAFNEQDLTLYYGQGTGGTGGSATAAIAIAGTGAFVSLVGSQTITGTKTFNGTTLVPTVVTGDSSTNAASTAWVNAQVYLKGNQSVSLTGDVTGTDAAGRSIATTLAATGVTAGAYGSSTTVAAHTVDAKGRVTAASNIAIAFPVTSVFGRTGAVVLNSGDVTGALGYTPVNSTSLGAANGVATLDASGKLTLGQIPSSLTGAVVYQGTWNASTNSPALTSGTGNKGQYYKVGTAGSTALDGISQWNAGDTVIFDGTTWDKIDGIANELLSVNGMTGVVVLTTSNIAEGSNLYFTTARAAVAAPVQSVAGRTGAVSLAYADISGLASMATQAASAVAITGGTIDAITLDFGTF